MSSLPTPLVVRFIADASGITSPVRQAMNQVQQQNRTTTQAIADDWKRMTVQIRADSARGVLSAKELGDAQRGLVTSLNTQIAALRQRNELNVKELASLKAMTLELERQKNALKTGSGVGITKGTENALNQVSTQTFLGISRTLDALVNRYFGGAAGATFRTLRDTAYYSSMAAGAGKATAGGVGAGEQGVLGGATGVLGKLFSPAGLATAGGVGALVAASAGVLKLSVDGGKLAVELTNLSSKTGLTTDSIIKLRSATGVLDVDFDRVVTGFRKFSQEITLASTGDLPNASQKAKEAAKLFNDLGVNIQQAAKDPFSAVQQLSRVLSTLPDGAVKTALAVQLFGRGGMELLPVLDRLPGALNATSKSSLDLIRTLTGGLVKSEEDLRAQMVNFKNETDALEVSLAQHVLPRLVDLVSLFNKAGDALDKFVGSTFGKAILHGLGAAIPGVNLLDLLGGSPSSSSATKLEMGGFLDYMKAQADSAKLQKEIAADLGTTAKAVKSQLDKVLSAFAEEQYRGLPHPKILGVSGTSRTSNLRSAYSPLTAPNASDVLFGLPASPVLSNLGLVASPEGILDQIKKVNDEYFQATASETDKIKKQYDDQLDYWRMIQIQYPAYAQQAADAITKIQETENKKLAELQDKQFEQYKRQADSLFEDLLSGNSKKFTKSLEKDLEDIVTEPFKKVFENIVGGLLQGLNTAINGGSSSGKTTASSGGGLSGILSGIFGGIFGPGGTAGTFPGSIGLGKPTTGVVGINSGQTGITTPTVNISAGQVNIGGASPSGGGAAIPGASNLFGTSGGFGSFFGNLNPFGGGNSFFGNLNPFGGSTTAGGSSSGSSGGIGSIWGGGLGQILGGLTIGGLGASHGSVTSEAMGAASAATGIVTALASMQKISPDLANSLGSAFGGAGLLASGLSQGGVSGIFSDAAGGMKLGSLIPGGLGTIIGGLLGALTGGIMAIFGQNSWSTRVSNAMKNQAIYLPPSESFSFASNGSIASTLQTGFGMSGNTGVTYALPSGTPFNASSIYGPLTNTQKSYLNQWMYGLNPNEPFFGAGLSGSTPANPFNGNIPSWWGGRAFPTSPSVQVHLNLPGFVDQSSVEPLVSQIAPVIAQHVSRQFNQFSSGMGTAARNSVNLP